MVSYDLSIVMTYASYGAGISVALIILAYMFGKLTENERYTAFAKSHFAETLLVFIILFSYVIFQPILESMAELINPLGYQACNSYKSKPIADLEIYQDPIPPTMSCYIGSSILFLDSIFYEVKYSFLQITLLQTVNGLIETTHFETPKAEKRANFAYRGLPLFSGWARIISVNFKNIANFLTRAAIFLYVQKYLLLFFYYAGPTIFGVGLFLRFFPVSRKIGGLLMAIFLAIIFVFPLTYNLFYALYLTNPTAPNLDTRLVRVKFLILEDSSLFTGLGKSPLEINREVEESIKTGKFGEKIDKKVNEIEVNSENYATTKTNEFDQKVSMNNNNPTPSIFSTITNALKDYLKFLWESTVGGEGIKSLFDFIGDIFFVFSRVHVFIFLQTNLISGAVFHYTGLNGQVAGLTLFDIFIEDTAHILLYTYLSSVIASLATIAVIKDLSPLLGGDIEIAGITHFI